MRIAREPLQHLLGVGQLHLEVVDTHRQMLARVHRGLDHGQVQDLFDGHPETLGHGVAQAGFGLGMAEIIDTNLHDGLLPAGQAGKGRGRWNNAVIVAGNRVGGRAVSDPVFLSPHRPPSGPAKDMIVHRFAAIDFETADFGRDSACALAVVRVEGRRIVGVSNHLIRPPRREFVFTYLHGISWADVKDQPTFAELWLTSRRELDDVEFLVAHNAAFDRSVLRESCARAGVVPPAHDFHCTVKIARHVWGLRPANLPAVCNHLGIPLHHHRAESDATACARIFIEALRGGWRAAAGAGTAAGRAPERATPAADVALVTARLGRDGRRP